MFIELGILNFKVLIIFLTPIALQTQRFIETDFENYIGLRGFNDFLSFTLCGIIYLLAKYFTKTEKQKLQEDYIKKKELEFKELNSTKSNGSNLLNSSLSSFQYFEMENLKRKKNKNIKQFLFIILISGFLLIGTYIKNIWREDFRVQLRLNISVLLESIFLIIFSVIFLGFSLYLHQYISLIILSICLIIFFIETLFYQSSNMIEILKSFFYFFCSEIFYCLGDVLGKKYLNSYIDGVYLFLFRIGITGLIPILLFDIIAFSIGIDPKYHGIIQTLFVEKKISHFFLNLIFCLAFEISLWLTIYYFSPCHFIILETLGDFCQLLFKIFIKDKNDDSKDKDEYTFPQKLTFLILYPVIIFSVLVFNEIIILNFCNLNYNTRKYIMNRERDEINNKIEVNINLLPIDLIDEDNNF